MVQVLPKTFLNIFFSVCVGGGACAGVPHAYVEIRSQLVGVGSLLQPCGSQGSKSGPQDHQQVSLPNEQQ